MNFLRKHSRLLLLSLLLLLFILIPFGIGEEPIQRWTQEILHGQRSRGGIAVALCGLLALDIVLPVPSSLVSTGAGLLLGFWKGALVSWIGMWLGCLVGYGMGRKMAQKPVQRLVGAQEYETISALMARYGDRTIALCRAVPVLAEASVLLAGMFGMPFRRFALLTAVSNLGISLVYAAVGAYSVQTGSFLLAFAGAILVPLLIMGIVRHLQPHAKEGQAEGKTDPTLPI
jgi:uncharacterized membrane protein YdjX (TVP38/TMEM64 family)